MLEKATRDAYGEALISAGEKYSNVVVVDCDLGGATKAKNFGERFPDRFFQVGIQEQNGVSMAAGLAIEGMRPFISSFGAFITQQAKAQIMNSVVYSKAPVVIVGSHSGLAIGKDGATQMGIDDLNVMYGIPGLEIYSPADSIETKQIVDHLANTTNPAYLRISRKPQPNIHEKNYTFKFNEAEILKEGNTVALFATGDMVYSALKSAEELNSKGIYPDIVNFSTLNPLDKETILKIAKKRKGIFTLEDHLADQGFGLRIKGVVSEEGIGISVKSIGIKGFGESGDPEELYKKHGMDNESIKKRIKDFYYGD